jgi:hypothetical protein
LNEAANLLKFRLEIRIYSKFAASFHHLIYWKCHSDRSASEVRNLLIAVFRFGYLSISPQLFRLIPKSWLITKNISSFLCLSKEGSIVFSGD